MPTVVKNKQILYTSYICIFSVVIVQTTVSQRFLLRKTLRNSSSYNNMQQKETGFLMFEQ